MDSGEADAAHELVVEETLEVPLLLPVEGALRELHGPLLVRDFGFLFGEVERIQRGEVVDEVNAGDSSLAGGALDPSVLSEVRQARRAEDMPANDEVSRRILARESQLAQPALRVVQNPSGVLGRLR